MPVSRFLIPFLNAGVEISEEVMQDIVQNISSPVEMAAMIKDLGVSLFQQVHLSYRPGGQSDHQFSAVAESWYLCCRPGLPEYVQ
ncbi:MAG: hypothetical protein MZV63_31355 [Marinilabiliales bacterium]|nr:hypothetical protein [Marinilabiliales bacterium]